MKFEGRLLPPGGRRKRLNDREKTMNAGSNNTMLHGLDRIAMTERRRVQVQEAVRMSETIVSMVIGLVSWCGLGARQ